MIGLFHRSRPISSEYTETTGLLLRAFQDSEFARVEKQVECRLARRIGHGTREAREQSIGSVRVVENRSAREAEHSGA